eukprot:GEZU01031211.1.p1 GENE.GEZU01031211.1~~GEZU01031211.1.p1  ORF type:complete len:120 (+),score=26.88 GEZU01031211.1:61-420(+)
MATTNSANNDSVQPVNVQAALEQIEDMDFLKDLLKDYIESARVQIEKIRKAIASGDNDTVHKEAHSLKGAGLTLRADSFGEACAQMEKAAKNNETDALGPILELMTSRFDVLRKFVETL